MVKRSVLEKLSDSELEKYVSPTSRYVADAVEIAYDILKKRNREFSEEERNAIESLIHDKRKQEEEELVEKNPEFQKFDDNITLDPNTISLFSLKTTTIFALFFGLPFAGLLLTYNLFKVNKMNGIIVILFFTIGFSVLQYFVTPYFQELVEMLFDQRGFRTKYNILKPYYLTMVGQLALFLLSNIYLEKGIRFRSKSFVFPFIASSIGCYLLYKAIGFIHGFSILFYVFHSINK